MEILEKPRPEKSVLGLTRLLTVFLPNCKSPMYEPSNKIQLRSCINVCGDVLAKRYTLPVIP